MRVFKPRGNSIHFFFVANRDRATRPLSPSCHRPPGRARPPERTAQPQPPNKPTSALCRARRDDTRARHLLVIGGSGVSGTSPKGGWGVVGGGARYHREKKHHPSDGRSIRPGIAIAPPTTHPPNRRQNGIINYRRRNMMNASEVVRVGVGVIVRDPRHPGKVRGRRGAARLGCT